MEITITPELEQQAYERPQATEAEKYLNQIVDIL